MPGCARHARQDSPSFDAAILDLQLPDKDGLALAEEIRALPHGRSTSPCSCFLRVRLRGDDPRPTDAGISVFVHKPIRPAQLLDALYRSLSIQLQREKKAPALPALDAEFCRAASRCASCSPTTIPSIKRSA